MVKREQGASCQQPTKGEAQNGDKFHIILNSNNFTYMDHGNLDISHQLKFRLSKSLNLKSQAGTLGALSLGSATILSPCQRHHLLTIWQQWYV